MRPLEFVRIGVWFGLVAGLAEVALLAVKKFYLGHLVKVGPDVVWLAPVADAALLTVIAAVIALLWAWRPSPRLYQAALAVFAFLSVLSVVLLESQVALSAKALIVAGVAWQTARILARHQAGFQRIVRRTLPWVASSVVLLAVGTHGSGWYGYRQAIARLPVTTGRPPNVLLIVLDTVRAQNLSLYGYHRRTTPNLARWAQRSVVFEQAIAPSSWTFPSHASMFTGRWPHELSADWHTPLDDRYPTIAEVLRDRGYLTAGFAANLFYCTAEFGLDRGFLHYEDYPVSPSQGVMSSSIGRELISFSLNQDFSYRFRGWIGYEQIPGRRTAAEINKEFLSWHAQQNAERPFFAFLNYLDAHQPFLPPSPYDGQFRGAAPRGDPRHWWDRKWSPEEIQTETDSYDEAIAYIDHHLGVLFDELNRRGELDHTVVVVTSDHGEHLGEHGFMRHGNTLYTEVLRVPLVILPPDGIRSPVTVRTPVSLRDLPATLLALAGVECGGCLPGHSLAHHWMAGPGASGAAEISPLFAEVSRGIRIPDRYPNATGELKSLIVGDLHYIVNSDGREELFDLAEDPREEHNLARSADTGPVRDRLKRQLQSIVQRRSTSESTATRGARR